jgi:hypothetical protein
MCNPFRAEALGFVKNEPAYELIAGLVPVACARRIETFDGGAWATFLRFVEKRRKSCAPRARLRVIAAV